MLPAGKSRATFSGLAIRAAAAMEKVDFGSGYGYEVGSKDKPAVVVIQEWWGKHSHTADTTIS